MALDFKKLERRKSPNDSLVCPAGYCPEAEADDDAPIFKGQTAASLGAAVMTVVEQQPRIKVLEEDTTASAFEFEQRSSLIGFKDLISIKCFDVGEDKASLAIYSRSTLGYSDLGVNRKRIRKWLADLKAIT